ncbi:MAG: hypothetical protein ABIC95_04685 [archaeon]
MNTIRLRGPVLNICALFMIGLVISLTFTHSAMAAGDAEISSFTNQGIADVTHVTGDLMLSVPLLNVPGVGGLEYPISLSYIGGGGIKMEQDASWVGLGWALSAGEVSRQVIGLPDDMESDSDGSLNVYMRVPARDERSRWEKFLDIFPMIVFAVASAFAFGILFSAFPWYINYAINVLLTAYDLYDDGKVSFERAVTMVVMTINVAARYVESLRTFASYASVVWGKAMNIYGKYKNIKSAISVVGYVFGEEKFSGKKVRDGFKSISGFLYDPDFQEAYKNNNYLVRDGGSPDFFVVGGIPRGGRMLMAHEETLDRFDSIDQAKFFLQTTPGLENVDITFFTDLPNCEYEDYISDLQRGWMEDEYGVDLKDDEAVACARYDEEIDMWVFTIADGTRYVFGDPSVPGSILRVIYKKEGMKYIQKHKDYWLYIPFWHQLYQRYPYSWKLTAILGADYVDGSPSPDLNPINSEGDNSGSWVAFTYQQLFTGSCGYFAGDTEEVPIGNSWYVHHRSLRDVSVLDTIQTPTHMAVFSTQSRSDGLEEGHALDDPPLVRNNAWYSNFNWYTGKFNDIYHPYTSWHIGDLDPNDCGWVDQWSSVTQPRDHLRRLDEINLFNKVDGSLQSTIRFNDGVSSRDMYYLMPGSEDSTAYPYKGKYSLERVDICAVDDVPFTIGQTRPVSCLPPYEFDYGEDLICNDRNVTLVDDTTTKTDKGSYARMIKQVDLSGSSCTHANLKIITNMDSSEGGDWKHPARTWIEVEDSDGNVIHTSDFQSSSGSDVTFDYYTGEHAVDDLTIRVMGYKCGGEYDRRHYRACWSGSVTPHNYLRSTKLKVIQTPSRGEDNPSYSRHKVDAWGLFYNEGGINQHNGPSTRQAMFKPEGMEAVNAWTLKGISWPNGVTTEIEYEPDTWFTSRGDATSPHRGHFTNYYNYIREPNNLAPALLGNLCEPNIGGGLRVSRLTECDRISGVCIETAYNYSLYDDDIGCQRTSGSSTIVPFSRGGIEDDNDQRRPSHMGSTQGTGEILYNQVSVRNNISTGHSTYYYVTSDSTPTTTDFAIDYDAFDGPSGEGFKDFESMGGSGYTDRSWARGQEYRIEFWSDDPGEGKDGLLKEVNRRYQAREHFLWFFGDSKVSGNNPITNEEETINFNNNNYGFSSGWTDLVEQEAIFYDAIGGGAVIKRTTTEFDEGLGLPTQITEHDGSRRKITTYDYAHDHYLSMAKRHMLNQIYQINIYEDEVGPNSVLFSATTEYGEFDKEGAPLSG